eukprot:TRINITY_DN5806_c0_g1_i1.p1 TRINITY_DN5806_c0_g1~~TRINITY_DN5806_c0_g1_i1.p1  ORF type:complete len:163 (+),score=52.92 TRINITY_DN5806_c0_g1_i1:280-768(+)
MPIAFAQQLVAQMQRNHIAVLLCADATINTLCVQLHLIQTSVGDVVDNTAIANGILDLPVHRDTEQEQHGTNACLYEVKLHAQRVDRGISTEQYSYVIALHLRDKLLSEGDRHLWPQIVKRVNGDSRVGKSVAILAFFPKGTDTWEWVAPFGTDEDDASQDD